MSPDRCDSYKYTQFYSVMVELCSFAWIVVWMQNQGGQGGQLLMSLEEIELKERGYQV